MRELFVYYRVLNSDAATVQAAVEGFHAQLHARHPTLIARLLRRPGAVDGWQTWMETYATDPMRAPAGITPELQADIEAQARVLLPMLDGPRHTEVFVAVS